MPEEYESYPASNGEWLAKWKFRLNHGHYPKTIERFGDQFVLGPIRHPPPGGVLWCSCPDEKDCHCFHGWGRNYTILDELQQDISDEILGCVAQGWYHSQRKYGVTHGALMEDLRQEWEAIEDPDVKKERSSGSRGSSYMNRRTMKARREQYIESRL